MYYLCVFEMCLGNLIKLMMTSRRIYLSLGVPGCSMSKYRICTSFLSFWMVEWGSKMASYDVWKADPLAVVWKMIFVCGCFTQKGDRVVENNLLALEYLNFSTSEFELLIEKSRIVKFIMSTYYLEGQGLGGRALYWITSST